MTNLTEQWKNGELEGEYYIETNYGKRYTCELQTKSGVKNKRIPLAKSFNGYVSNKSVAEVLAPVPSYEELQKLKEHCRVLKEALTNHEEIRNGLYNECDNLEKENQKLKELLKECKKALNKAKGNTVWYPVEIDHILTKIDEVLK